MKPIGEIRRDNLETRVSEFGTLEALAKASGTSAVYLSQVRKQTIDQKTGKGRQLGSALARRLEATSENARAEGWMDQDNSQQQIFTPNAIHLAQMYESTPPRIQAIMYEHVKQLYLLGIQSSNHS